MAVGFPAKTDFATGDVLTATNVNDITGTLNLLQGANQAGGKNLVINGDFGVWQRGTSFTSPSFSDYTADRFKNVNYNVAPTTYSISRQSFATADAPATMFENGYFFRSTLTTIGSTTVYDTCSQRIEGVLNSGATMTLSFYAKSDSSRTQQALGVQNYGSGGSAEITSLAATSFTTTTAWQRFTFTFTVFSTSGKTIGTSPYFYFFIRQACASGSVLDVTGVQLEYASTASGFQTASGSIGGELALCQRYYFRSGANSGGTTSTFSTYGQGFCSSTTEAFIQVYYPSSMRVNPTALEYASIAVADSTGSFFNVVSVAFNQINTESVNLYLYGLTGLTANRPARLANNNNTAGYFAASAEL
jgi:hypothetical protein